MDSIVRQDQYKNIIGPSLLFITRHWYNRKESPYDLSCFDDPTGSGQRERVLVINNNGPSPSLLLSLLTLTWSQHRSVTPASRVNCFRIDC